MSAFYDDVIFPQSIALSAFKGSRTRDTGIVSTQSGFTQRRGRRVNTLRTYDAGLVTRPVAEWRQIDDFYEIVAGPEIGFLLLDPTDYQVTSIADGLLQLISDKTYSFQRVRTLGAHSVYRAISKPDVGQAAGSSTIVIWQTVGGVTTIVSASNYTVDGVNGTATFTSGFTIAPGTTFAWTGNFYVPARFATDSLDWTVVDKQVGAGKLLVNGPSVPITEEPWPGTLYIPST